MPIKFRCKHCQQFLGISQTKAGGVVDCPACGRSIRVPQSDGVSEPVPKPSPLQEDSKLSEAFEQLGNLSEEPTASPTSIVSPAATKPAKPQPIQAAPQPVTNSVAIDPPVPVSAPVSVPTALNPVDSNLSVDGVAAIDNNNNHSNNNPFDEVASLNEFGSASSFPQGKLAPKNKSEKSEKFQIAYRSLLALLAGLAAVAFIAGYGLGILNVPPAVATNNSSDKKGARKPLPSNNAVLKGDWKKAVTGRISYRTETGESRPDRGARVLLLPQKRIGTVRLTAVGLRPSDEDVDFLISKTSLQMAGANVVRVDDEGRFEIKLPAAGTYQILVLSRFVSRKDADQSDDKMLQTLSEFFLKPANLLGHVATVFGTIKYNGADTIEWDHPFQSQ